MQSPAVVDPFLLRLQNIMYCNSELPIEPAIRFHCVDRHRSGEYVEMTQLAEAAGGVVTHDVPLDGTLLYQVQLVIGHRALISDVDLLSCRQGKTAWILGALRAIKEVDVWRQLFKQLNNISPYFFARSRAQIDYLKLFDIDATYLPNNEIPYDGIDIHKPKTVLYSGFYWHEKQLPLFFEVARLLPDWIFMVHIGMDQKILAKDAPKNVVLDGTFRDHTAYMQFLASHQYIWIPRTESQWIYPGRSGLSAIASGRPTILPRVGPNNDIPDDVVIKYDTSLTAQEIADIITAEPTVNRNVVKDYLSQCSPQTIWHTIKTRLSNTIH